MGKKKREQFYSVLGIFVVITLLLVMNGQGEASGERHPLQALTDMIAVMDKHDIEVREWSLYTRNERSQAEQIDDFQVEWKKLKEQTPGFLWNEPVFENGQQQIKASGKLTDDGLGVTETLTYVVYPHNQKWHSYLIYEISGTKGDQKSIENTAVNVQIRLQDLFTEETKFFTCITGNYSDKLNLGLFDEAERIMESLSGQKIEQLREETFVSLSAYTTMWDEKVVTNGQDMNLQVAIRDQTRLGGQTTVTIGTPIITTEY